MAPLAANGNNLFIGRGRLFFDRFDANFNPTGSLFVGEAGKIDLTPNVEKKERRTTTKAANSLIASVITQQTHSFAIDLLEFTKENISLALLGQPFSVVNAMTTLTNEMIAGGAGQAPPAKNRTYWLSRGNISAVTLVALASDGTTSTPLVAGTDYQIEDAVAGAITLLSTAAAAGATIKATTYTSGASTSGLVKAGVTANIRGAWRLLGDPTSGQRMDLRIWNTEVTPSAALSLLSDDYATMSLTGDVLDASAMGHDSLYEIVYPNG